VCSSDLWEGRAPLASHPGVDRGEEWELIAPSAVPHSEKYATPCEMTQVDIADMVEAWGSAAERADAAGFDAIEVHAAHGYLIHQFLSAEANKRTDQYGGSLENRMRFAAEVARRTRRSWPEEKPLFFRLSVVDDVGWTVDDSIALSRLLKTCGVDVIDCSTGGMLDHAGPVESIGYGYQVKYARAVRAAAGVMTMAVGMIIHGDQAERILRDGSADLVAIGREFLHNPNWPFDAAQKLGIEAPFALLPPNSGYYLEKRSQNAVIRPSTWQRGIDEAAKS
jgi:2,4-dienoyl-CoA reductase-like NADH-dependent reductase (Old Yellow Enzyme family)